MDKVWVPDSARKHEKVVVQTQRFEKDLVRQKNLLGFVDPGLGPFGGHLCTRVTLLTDSVLLFTHKKDQDAKFGCK